MLIPVERRVPARINASHALFLADPTGLERWYVGVSIVLGMFVPIVPAALGHFGYDPILNVWFVSPSVCMAPNHRRSKYSTDR